MVTISAEDNDIDAPAKELTVSAAVTSGPASASQTLTITAGGTTAWTPRTGE